MIQFFHVHRAYGKEHALADVSVDIDKGELVYLTGPSGAGKSTFLRLIYAADRPTSGQLLVAGRNIARLEPSAIATLRRQVGVVFQDFRLLPQRTVEANVAIALEVQRLPERDIKRRAFMVLKQVGLGHKLHQFPASLSGGEQQRVAIARALVAEPQILLADEPTGALDPERATEVMDLLFEANARGATVVIATHDRSLLERRDGRVIRLATGRVESEGP